jgi:hypothetical protein
MPQALDIGLPPFAATGVGSVPGTQAAAAAARILRVYPQLPHWPQLPALGLEEGMLWQFLPRVPGLPQQPPWAGQTGLAPDRLRPWLEGRLSGSATPMDTAPGLEALLASGIGPGWVKGQLTGPVTLACCLHDATGRPLRQRPELLEPLLRRLAEAGRRQAQRLRRLRPRVLLCVDEPALFRLQAGSGGALQAGLRELIAELRAEAAAVAVHTCGPPDWAGLTALGADVLNVDVGRYPPQADELPRLREFLQRDGRIAWGLVPAAARPPPVAELAAPLERLVQRLGPEAARRSLLTPACGTATLSEADAKAVERRVAELGRWLQRRCSARDPA